MKAPAVRTVVRVDFGQEAPQGGTVATVGRVPRVTRLLALAHRIDWMVLSGEIADYAEAARRLGFTRARVTQITNMLLLAPEIQEEILCMPPTTVGRDPVTERQLRPMTAEMDWDRQVSIWESRT